MTKPILTLLVICLGLTVSLAQKSKAITPLTYSGRQIIVGSGGGFTGRVTSYYFLEDGKLFIKRSPDTTFTLLGVQTAANTKRAFSTLETVCQIKTTKFDEPGNTYRFIRWKKGKEEYRVIWGGSQQKPPANYPKFYESFMAMIPKK